jgi:DNA-binding NarL/FixJ family response regulator
VPERPLRHATGCPACDGAPTVLVAIRHPVMRRLTADLLAREYGCWVTADLGPGQSLAGGLARTRPDLVVVDAADFPACCPSSLEGFPRSRVVVIGPEPDPGYRSQAMGAGAGAWISRERVGDELGAAMRAILGCVHDPCPPPLPAHDGGTRARGVAAR